MDEVGHQHAVILDGRDRPIQWLSRRQLGRIDFVGDTAEPRLPVIGNRATLNDALDTMLVSSTGAALVTGRAGAFLGVIDVETVMDAITSARASAAGGVAGAPVGTNTGTIGTVGADTARAERAAAAAESPDSPVDRDGLAG
jgi:osmoprotectant transport system ATP-binding protein